MLGADYENILGAVVSFDLVKYFVPFFSVAVAVFIWRYLFFGED